MAGNPLVDQGVLNRLRGAVTWTNFPGLNVTASFLDKDGIRLALEGEMSTQHGTLAGVVQSPEPYIPISVTINLLKTQALAEAYKAQWENNVLMGQGTVYPDVSVGGISAFQLQNMSIQSVTDISMAGDSPRLPVVLKGFYVVNNSLWN